jgi:hypothetical protein
MNDWVLEREKPNFMKAKTKSHFGRVGFTSGLPKQRPEEYEALLAQFSWHFITRLSTRTMCIVGVCPKFDLVESGAPAPCYRAALEKKDDGEVVVTFTRESWS